MNEKIFSHVEHKHIKEVTQKDRQLKSESEWFEEIFMKPRNKRFSDGRVYGGVDEFGNYIAHSVSPKMSEFESQIEDMIYPAVKALIDKGYYTICSCHGHPTRANIKIGFGTEECRNRFMNALSAAKIKSLYMIPHSHCINNQLDNDTGKIIRRNDEIVSESLMEDHVRSFNLQFSESYKKWYFLDVNLFKPYSKWSPITMFITNYHLKNKKVILSQLASAFESDKFPSYRGSFRKSLREISGKGESPFL